MIDLIRDEIKNSVKECNDLYKEIDRPFFNAEDVTQDKLKYKYHAEIGTSSQVAEEQGESVTQVNVLLRTFVQAGRDKNKDYDEAYNHALMINLLLLDRSKIINQDYIKGVQGSDINPVEVVDSQDVYSYETNLVYTISYGIGE